MIADIVLTLLLFVGLAFLRKLGVQDEVVVAVAVERRNGLLSARMVQQKTRETRALTRSSQKQAFQGETATLAAATSDIARTKRRLRA